MRRFTYRDENGKAWANLKTDCTGEQRIQFGRETLEALTHYEDLIEQGKLIEVVQCGECKHYAAPQNYTAKSCWCSKTQRSVNEEDYCNHGERRE